MNDLSKDRLRLWLQLLKLTRKIETRVKERLRDEHATTLPRFDVMAALSRCETGMKMSEISGVLKVSNGNVTGIVDRLAQDGLAQRIDAPGDRRVSLVRLTARGRAEFAGLAKQHEAWIDAMFSGVGAGEVARLRAGLEALSRKMDKEESA